MPYVGPGKKAEANLTGANPLIARRRRPSTIPAPQNCCWNSAMRRIRTGGSRSKLPQAILQKSGNKTLWRFASHPILQAIKDDRQGPHHLCTRLDATCCRPAQAAGLWCGCKHLAALARDRLFRATGATELLLELGYETDADWWKHV